MLSRRRFVLALSAMGGGMIRTARAQSADALRASGDAGERFDGYMEARKPSAASAVDAINAQRRKVYEDRAKQQNAPVEEVGRVYAQQIIGKVSSGTWIKSEAGDWSQK
ncbi:MAG: YdbL family protein [Gammaproteobacteria bacterium]|nr:YdbL family protein [Gammaproteobacteria bacterium]